jgi:hypothetical protein
MAAVAQERVFTCNKGVELADTGKTGEYQKWASFEPDDERTKARKDGKPVFSFTTSDPKVAERLASAVHEDYKITEVTADAQVTA